jgi:ABC-type dipeptide/oligopeptide/nickel transport system permease component
VILYSVVLIGMGLVVDLLYAWLDPRVRFER